MAESVVSELMTMEELQKYIPTPEDVEKISRDAVTQQKSDFMKKIKEWAQEQVNQKCRLPWVIKVRYAYEVDLLQEAFKEYKLNYIYPDQIWITTDDFGTTTTSTTIPGVTLNVWGSNG